jgi:two-component system phosphate regulon sensor histidine kinase PhoR
MDLDHPETGGICEEIAPLLSRMKRRNAKMEKRLAKMRKTQIEFAAITDHMREGLLVLDREAHVLSCNQSALRLLGARKERVENNQNVLTLRRDEPFRAVVEQALAGASSEAVLALKEKHLQIMANPVMDKGRLQGAILVLLDVTEREDREKLRREFSANVSHELKTPVMAISGYAEIMARGVAKAEDMPDFAKKIYDEAQRLISLVDDIMMLSKLDEKNIPPTETVALNAMIQKALERIEGNAAARGVTLDFVQEAGQMEIMGIRPILDEMIYNLLDNAVKYNIEGGKVIVRLQGASDRVTLSISDTGVGIPPGEQERVFERFYRVDKSRSAQIPGTGLGLSIVKHGAALHSAKVKLQSDGKSYTRVEIVFTKISFS